jgi:hypothetical protein
MAACLTDESGSSPRITLVAPRAFVSFELEDAWARNFLRQHARTAKIPFEFIDYSVKEPFESKWKTNVKERIARTKGTIVLIGPTTSRSTAVLWEIAETKKQLSPVFGIQINRDLTHPVPKGVPANRVVRWNFEVIKRELGRW